MKKLSSILLAGLLLLTACGNAATGDIEIHQAWVRPTAQGNNAAVYFTIHNHSDQADELTGITTNISDAVEIHSTSIENDVMKMEMLTSIPLAADDEIVFEPGGTHVMLNNIKQELVLGEHIGIVLHFKNHADIVVEVHIEEAMPEEDHDH